MADSEDCKDPDHEYGAVDCKDTHHEYGAVDNNYKAPLEKCVRQLTDHKDPSQKAIAAVHNDPRQH